MTKADNTPGILQVLPELNTGGVERGTIDIAAAISQHGWRSYVASAGGKLEPKLGYSKSQSFNLPLASKSFFTIWSNAGKLENIIRENNISIIHARSRAPGWSSYWSAKSVGIPLVTTFHGFYGLQSALKKRYNRVMTYGERVIAVSNEVAKHIIENYSIDPDKLRIIHRGVDLKIFAPDKIVPQRMADLSRQWNLPDDGHPVLMLPGRLTRWKGQEFAIRAAAKLPHRNFHLVLVGSGDKHPDYVEHLRQVTKEVGLEDQVRMVGDTQYMPEAYMLASLVLSPSMEPEAFGRVATEAQAMGKPIIATRHGGAMETVLHGDTGWLVTPGGEEELAQTIHQALSLPEEEKQRMRENALWNIHTHFSLEVMQRQTLAVYEEVLSAGVEVRKAV